MKTTRKKILIAVALIGAMAFKASVAFAADARPLKTDDDKLIAIDVLLEPDQTMVGSAEAVNARLRENSPAGYELDATHAPHITLVQRFVRVKDFDSVAAAVSKVLAEEQPDGLRLKTEGIHYVIWGGQALTTIMVERTPELMRLHEKVIEAVEPFSVSGGTGEAFVGTGINQETVAWVETFVPKATRDHYAPHVTAGVANEVFVKQLKAEPYKPVTFGVDGVAVYQLGNFGTAAKKLWQNRTSDPLPSWNNGKAKQSIVTFVEKVTKEGSPDFVPVAQRIATFDNDGTLWAEQPMYFQFLFALDRVKTLAPDHPEWRDQEPFASLLKGDVETALEGGEKSFMEIMLGTHAGMTTEEFEKTVKEWIATARHPVTKKLFTEMVYQPMLELLAYLRANGFKTFIVSGGGIEFMRPWTEKIYGIPPEQVVGSSIKTKFEMREGKPVLVRLPEVNFNDDKNGKPVGINEHIGRRPIAAFGNSDGDLEMLQWTDAGDGTRFCLYIHHDDAQREWAYDHPSHIGQLEKGLVEAKVKGWTVVSMKDDWKTIFSPGADSNP